MPPVRRPRAPHRDKAYMISKRLSVTRAWIEQRFDLPSSATDKELRASADMLRCPMMDYGVYEWPQLQEYLKLRQQWPALYERWAANKDHPHGTEWAVFDKQGRIHIVRHGGAIVTESLPFPNKYALGPTTTTCSP
jgi:hypothetical protein